MSGSENTTKNQNTKKQWKIETDLEIANKPVIKVYLGSRLVKVINPKPHLVWKTVGLITEQLTKDENGSN